jgi:hypothetical protein
VNTHISTITGLAAAEDGQGFMIVADPVAGTPHVVPPGRDRSDEHTQKSH